MPPLFTDTENIGYNTRTLELEKTNVTLPCFFIYIIRTYPFPAVTCYNFQQKGLICFGGVT